MDFNSFLLLVPGSQCFIPNGIDIIFDSVVIPVSSIFAFCEKPAELIRWIATTSSFARFDTQVLFIYLFIHLLMDDPFDPLFQENKGLPNATPSQNQSCRAKGCYVTTCAVLR